MVEVWHSGRTYDFVRYICEYTLKTFYTCIYFIPCTRRDKYSGYNEAQYKRCIEQCFQEIIFLNRLKSEFIIPILAYSDSPDPCIVYQFMPNGSLLDRYRTVQQHGTNS